MKVILFFSEKDKPDISRFGEVDKCIDQNSISCNEILDFLNMQNTIVITNCEGAQLIFKYLDDKHSEYNLILGKLALVGHLSSIQQVDNIPGNIIEHILIVPYLPELNEVLIGVETITEDLEDNISKIFKNNNILFTNIKTATHVYSMFQLMSACKSSVWSVVDSIGFREELELNLLSKLLDSYFSSAANASSNNSTTNYQYIRSLIEYLRVNSLPTHFTEGVLRNLTFYWRMKNNIGQKNKPNLIEFYNVDEPFGFLSNFSEHPIFMNGVIWPTVEHYYQGQKFTDSKYQECIRMEVSPVSAKELSHKLKDHHRSDWKQFKVEIMRQALNAKFSQHPDLKNELLGTGKLKIVEKADNDEFWGNGKAGAGVNMLGLLLMEIRESLNKGIE